MPRIVIPVSNVLRDLHGDVLLAVALARHGFTTYLLPTRRLRELYAIAPDMVLLHQLRSSQEDFTRTIQNCGIQTCVLDVEGMEKIDKYAKMVARDEGVKRHILSFMAWGHEVAEYLTNGGGYAADQVTITGSPRHDFYTAPLKNASLKVNAEAAAVQQPMILINANFPYANHPTAKKGSDAATKEGESLGIVDDLLVEKEQQEIGMRHMVEIANTLAERFPQAAIVYRPHPFEDLETYKTLLQLDKYPNLKLIREGSVDGWILRAKAVIQRSCVTAVESALSGVPTLSPRWFPAKDYPVPESVSIPASSMDELSAFVDQALTDEVQVPASVQEQLDTAIHDWFYQMDGKAHERVVDVVIAQYQAAQKAGNKVDQAACLRELYHLDRPLKSKRRQLDRFLRYHLRRAPETSDQIERREQNVVAATRRYDAAEVQGWIDAIQSALTPSEKTTIHARQADRRDTLVPMTCFTVVVEP